jgi:hypothetical protein
MKNLDLCKGLRSYGVYKFKDYPEWDIVCTNITEDDRRGNYMTGLAFTESGRFDTMVTLKLPMKGQEVGYIYIPNVGYSLNLELHNRS